ncbi:MAG: DUF362 domain-containing protein [Chloroflexota bacterium]
MTKSVVSIVKGTNAEKMVEEALSLLGGVTALIKPGSTVVVKPNAIGGYPSERGADTSPAMVGAVIKELRKAQPKEIIMAESTGGVVSSIKNMEGNGQKKAAEDASVDKVIDIKEEKDLIKVPIRDHRSALEFLLLPRFLVEADHIVNLPIFKTHVSMVYTCALKNMKGIVQGPVHGQMHLTDLGYGMMDLWSIMRADLQIVDMIRPGEGYGPLAGIPTDFGCVVAGRDPVAVDATCCRMTGLDITKVPSFEAIRERNIGKYKEEDIEIRGRKIKEVFKKLRVPYMDGWSQYPEFKVIAKDACTYCEGVLAYNLERLKSLNEYEKNAGMTIVLGRNARPPKGVKPRDLILFGECVKEFRDQGIWVQGCPPNEGQPAAAIMDRRYDGWGAPTPSKRNYRAECTIFVDYLNKKLGKRP